MLRYGFESLRLHRVIATCQPENAASWRVMEKLGMQREAHFRKAHLLDGET
jgi:ribosomal-protein-alanine N-acetyltransferase